MFTGIVEEVGKIKAVRSDQIAVYAAKVLEGTKPGDSLAVNGACLTVSALDATSFTVAVMPETLRKTNLGSLRTGSPVNLERAMAAGGRFGGHLVQGHIDATGKVISFTSEGGAIIAKYAAPPEVMRYIVKKGFIAIDGVSLTVVDLNATSFTVSLVAFTQGHTLQTGKRPGDSVNLEVDIMAKYVEKFTGKGRPGITSEFLAEHNF